MSAREEAGRYNHVNKARCDGGLDQSRVSRRRGTKHVVDLLLPRKGPDQHDVAVQRVVGPEFVSRGSGTGCRLWTVSAYRPCRAVRVSWCRGAGRLQTDSDGIAYHAYLGRHAADVHPHPHPHPHPHAQSTHQSVDRSISQSISTYVLPSLQSLNHSVPQSAGRSVGRSVGRSRQIESYRVGGRAVSTSQRAAASSLHPLA